MAFLRGINVSGQKLIKMDSLRKILTVSGFTDVKTYIQSGNLLFNAEVQDTNHLIRTLENLIEKHYGFHTDVILRKQIEIETVLKSLESCRLKSDDDRKFYVTFAKEEFPVQIEVPLFSKNQDVEIIYHNSQDFISVSTEFKGNFGFPNSFIEKLTGMPATTRNPNTLEKILKL